MFVCYADGFIEFLALKCSWRPTSSVARGVCGFLIFYYQVIKSITLLPCYNTLNCDMYPHVHVHVHAYQIIASKIIGDKFLHIIEHICSR